ncbi:MAG TPA: GntR family transcriptional regulator [Kofleriaceae bacterium]|nr:GntR family transcriptional regulator [Kofleriaceae bacterium]
MPPKPELSPPPLASEPSSAEGAVFDALVADIVRGTYPPGSRLPAERELARILGASRPTLREALRRLDEWNMVEARRGSGIVVREVREWMIEALPAYLRHARPGPDRPTVAQLAADILLLRRLSMVDMLRMMAGRVPAGATQVAREHAERAWSARGDAYRFAEQDFQVIRALAEAARSLPAMWMINRIAGVYLDIARSLAGALSPPEDYLEVYGRVLDAVDRGDGDGAARELDAYLERHDTRLFGALGGAR